MLCFSFFSVGFIEDEVFSVQRKGLPLNIFVSPGSRQSDKRVYSYTCEVQHESTFQHCVTTYQCCIPASYVNYIMYGCEYRVDSVLLSG